jgi:cytochrome c553
MKTLLAILGIVSMLGAADGAALYKQCASCHGKHAEKSALGKSKIVKDMRKEEIVAALNGYKDGSYGGSMKALMKGKAARLSDADIKALADFIDQQ